MGQRDVAFQKSSHPILIPLNFNTQQSSHLQVCSLGIYAIGHLWELGLTGYHPMSEDDSDNFIQAYLRYGPEMNSLTESERAYIEDTDEATFAEVKAGIDILRA